MMGMDVLLGNSVQESSPLYGVFIGIVTNTQDPKNLGRVKLSFPWLSNPHGSRSKARTESPSLLSSEDTLHSGSESTWARLAIPMAGMNRGFYFIPEVGDEVLVAFEMGDIRSPYVLGALWNGKDKPPATNSDGKNNVRMLKSRSGHTIILDDTEGKEKITIQDKTGKNTFEIDSAKNTINIQSEQNLTIQAKGNINLKSANGNVAIEGMNVSIKAKQNYQIEANANGSLQAQGGLAIKCLAGVRVNDGALEVT